MITLEATHPASASNAVPYVGLRPFAPDERDLFYGRDADAQFLVDKILSARVTLLYAPSGVGKSSLLRARVLSSLEDQDCQTVYFDSWAGADPAADLKRVLSDIARASGIADPMAGAPTIAELVQLRATDNRTMVVVLDQFEEFLINHATRLDPLRKELAALVRSQAVDARVVISLREEFLAAIEPFRQEIPTLFHSTYRLEPLSPKAVRDAVINPATKFDADVELQLAECLNADLSDASGDRRVTAAGSDAAGSAHWLAGLRSLAGRMWRTPDRAEPRLGIDDSSVEHGATPGAIDLPMLQLVCEHMWRAAPVVDGRKQLTLQLYQKQLGGKQQILDGHIRSRMPKRWRDRLFTATLMKFLAPPSGLKISYSAGDLAAYTGLDESRVERELRRLSGADTRILREREFKDSVRFELQHDALIRHITPWRDRVLGEASAIRRLKWAGAALALIAALLIGARVYHWKEVRDNTDRRLSALGGMSLAELELRSGSTFETVASYLLFQERGTERLVHLKRLLVQRQDLLPRSYAIGSPAMLDDRSDDVDVIAMRYNEALRLDVQSFNRAWNEIAHQTTGRWGIPVPARVRLIPDPDFPRNSVQIEAQSRDPVPIELEAPEGSVLVSMAGAPESAWEFHRQFDKDWSRLPALGDTWWAVPRWSLPVWRAAGLPVWSRSAYPAFAMQARFERNPTMLLIPAAVDFLVQRVGKVYPCTAAEVSALRASRLPQDVAAWMDAEHPRPLLHPHLAFDVLADLRTNDTPTGAAPPAYLGAVGRALGAAWPQSSGSEGPCKVPEFKHAGFQGVDPWLPPLQPKIRITLGSELRRAWTNEPIATEGGQRSAIDRAPKPPGATPQQVDPTRRMGTAPEVTEAFEHFRESFFRRTGIWLPTPALVNDPVNPPSSRQLRIMLLDVPGQTGRSVDVPDTARAGIDRVIAVLDEEASRATLAWVDAEVAGRIRETNARVDATLKSQGISTTDLKLLLRAVLTPQRQDGPAATADMGSIRDSDFLLPSLVFWKAYYTDEKAPQIPELLMDLARGMRRIQSQRYATLGPPKPGEAAKAIEDGIRALEAGQLVRAEALFEQSLRVGRREDVEQQFVSRYAARWQASRRARSAAACLEPTAGKLDESLRIDVEAFLAEPQAKADPAAARKLALCLLSSMPATVPQAKAALRLRMAREYGTPDQWPAADAGWFAAQVFEQYDPLHDADAVLAEGTRFMKAAVRRLPDEKATELFYGLEKTCLEPGPNNWCWPLLAEVADVRPDVWTSLDLALILADRESVEEMHAASSRLERARSLLRGAKGLSLEQRQLFDFWATFVEAKVHYALFVMTGNARDLEEARRLIPAMFTNPAIKAREGPEVAAIWLGTRIFNDGEKPEPEAARALRTGASPTAQTDTGFLSNALFDGLRAGDVESVRKIASQAQAKTRDTTAEQSSDPLFVASIGGLLTDPERTEWTARKFMGTGHVYAPVVSMLLIARSQGPARDGAKQLMEERWARIDPATWDKRLVLGDRTAWYEMLLGYFAGRVPAGTIFDPLQDDQAFAASKFAGLHVTRRALLTEARFYDAVRLMAAGDSNRAMASLHQAIDLGYKRYIEYDMAVHLLRLASGSK